MISSNHRDTSKAVETAFPPVDDSDSEMTEILNRTKKNSEYKKNILVYVSGFIQRRVLGKESCTQCTAYLKDGKFAHSGDLIKRKNRGSLIIPHDSVVQVVKKENQVL